MTERFKERSVESPRLIAEMLLTHVLKTERLRLYMEVDRPASPEELALLRDLVAKAMRHEPVQYLVGEGWFFGRPFHVNRSTLIPRPCTEVLVQHVIEWARRRNITQTADMPPLRIADIGTGTGCIAISLLAALPNATCVATDVVPEALELARDNAARHHVAERMDFRLGSLCDPFDSSTETFDVIASNPPYIPDDEWDTVGENVKGHEPDTALRAGPDGMNCIRPLLETAAPLLNPGGLLIIELAASRTPLALEIAQAAGWSQPRILKDHENHPRFLIAAKAQ